eukprot:scaffold103053_cov96-Phaeocystis_antarctica.AAC.3
MRSFSCKLSRNPTGFVRHHVVSVPSIAKLSGRTGCTFGNPICSVCSMGPFVALADTYERSNGDCRQ